MADDRKDDDSTFTRRSVLQRAAVSSAALGVGVPALTGVAAATKCPRTPGYWQNHDWPGEGDDPDVEEDTGLEQVNQALPPTCDGGAPCPPETVNFASEDEGRAFLEQSTRGDKGLIMASQFVATVLNYQFQGGGGKGSCVTAGVADVDGDGELESMNEIVEYAQQWLIESSFPDRQMTWRVEDAPVQDGEVLKDYLDAWNNANSLGLPGCGC